MQKQIAENRTKTFQNTFQNTVLLLTLILISTINARPTSALLNVTINWDVIADGILNNVSLDVNIPTNSQNQQIISMNFSDPYTLVADTESKIRFEFENVRAKRITGNFIIKTDYLERSNSTGNERNSNEYLGNTTYIIIDDKIEKITENFTQEKPYDLYEMMNWVYKNVKYNASFTDVEISDITQSTRNSSWVLENKVGVCDEFTNLFAALSRAKGYPTRTIIGYVYVDKKWIPHAWAEAYYPQYGWIEIDPTHNQFMNLNALRVRTGTSSDISKLQDSISASSTSAKTVNLETSTSIQIINYSEEKPIEEDVFFSPQPPLDINQPTIVQIKNKMNSPVFVNAIFIPPVSVECENCSRYMIIGPNKTEEIHLNLKLPAMLPNVKYIYPNTLLTEYGTKEVQFEREYIEQTIEEKYQNLQDIPDNFKLFIGLFIVAAVALVAIAILLGL